MPPDTATNEPGARHDGWNTLSRFLPYLWPRDNPALRWRIVVASLLILASTGVQLSLPYLLKWAVDAMNVTGPRVAAFVMLTVLGYSAGRFLGTGFDNLRNIVFERVGQDATRALAENVFSRLHKLSLRFHLGRRTGEVRSPIDGLVTFIRGVPSMWPRATLANVLPVLAKPAPWKAPSPR